MRSRFVSSLILPVALLLTAFTPLANAAVQDRIAGAASGGSRVVLSGTIGSHARHSIDLGPAPADLKLQSLSLRFSMTPAQQADLTQLLAAQLNPSSPSYHQWLTPEQFGARFGLSSSDLAKVAAWLTGQGFTVTGVARSSTFITFSGTVAQAQQAFGTTIHNVSLNGEQHIANLTDPTLPSAFASVVNAVTGLNDFKPKSRVRAYPVTIDPSKPLFTQTIGGVTSHYISPADFYTIYDFGPLTSANITGAGITIAVVGQTDLTLTGGSDPNIVAFRTAAGLPAINLRLQLAGQDPGISQPDIDEAHIDLEWSGAAAPGASIVYVYGVDAFANSMTYAVDNKVAPIISSSYGGCEAGFGTALLATYNQLLAQANAQGETVTSSSGDAGAADCDGDGLATEGLGVDFPGSSPYATAAGGTMFSGDVNTPAQYWNSQNASNGGSALSYIPEQPWNETTPTGGLTAGGAGGGGASAYFSKPAWQVGTGVPNDGSRDLPDISLNAAAAHDGYLACSQGDGTNEPACTNGFVGANNAVNVFGGTSFVAPTFSGILALVEQQLATPNGLGNVGPVLYGFFNGPTYSSVFHDIITGNNSIPCAQGTPNCPNGGSIGFNAGTGYDLATGMGSFDASKLVTGWSSVAPVGTGGAIGAGITTTSVTTTNSLCGISSSSNIPLSVTVAGPSGGPTPTGTVQFYVDNVAVTGGTANLSGSGSSATATYSLVTSALSSGGHNISAVYSGDGNFAGSKGTLLGPATNTSFYPNGQLASVDIVSATTPDFSLGPCTGSATAVTVAPGGTSTGITFTVTPANGFTGSVTLIATNNDSMMGTTSFSVSPISITTSSGVTTSFVVKAFQTTTQAKPGLMPFHQHPLGNVPWYAAGSGATLACMLLLTFPRRRRWGALLAVLISVAALSAAGCGSNTSTTGGGGGGGGGGTTTPAAAGTYTFTITAVSGTLVHSTQATVIVP
jgi:pro-kumamolisin-like protein/Big-like domain-containing protein